MNDDCDSLHYAEGMWQEDDMQTGPADCSDNAISCMRDLEDFARLHIRVGADISGMSGVTYSLKFANVTGTPMVNVFEAVKPTDEYLTSTNVAAEQIKNTSLTPDGIFMTEVSLDSQCVKTGGEVSPFLIEGCTPGTGDLTLIVRKDGVEICRKSVRLTLKSIKDFYDVYSVSATGERWEAQVDTVATHSQTASYQPKTSEKLLFVHGWNMEGWEKRRWTETMFKRLWWQGYQGSVALFDWPTLYGFSGSWWDVTTDARHFDNSEYISWLSADALAGLMSSLNADGQLRLLAHSMGNVVTAEALRKYSGPQIKAYIATQAALSAQYYDAGIAPNQPALYLGSPDTPDVMGCFPVAEGETSPYCFGYLSCVEASYNYHNAGDWALDKWAWNNRFKPDGGVPYNFMYSGSLTNYTEGADEFYRQAIPYVSVHETQSVTNEIGRHRIFAYCAESRSCALGQSTNAIAEFTGWDLKSNMGYDKQHYSHSRQFRSNAASENLYWKQVMLNCGFENP